MKTREEVQSSVSNENRSRNLPQIDSLSLSRSDVDTEVGSQTNQDRPRFPLSEINSNERDQRRFIVEDHTSKWNLDLESGAVFQNEALPIPASSISTELSADNDNDRDVLPLPEELGIQYGPWCRSWQTWIRRINESGGDFPVRAGDALRAALGSFLFFSLLVFSNTKYLGVIWIGNIFFHNSLKRNLGEAMMSARGFARSVILVTILSWPVSFFLGNTKDQAACLWLPVVTFCLSLLIMFCPYLTSPNLMILVMYVVVATPVRFDFIWWEPLGYVASYLIGVSVAVIMQVLPFFPPCFRPNTASCQVHKSLKRLSSDFFLLFIETRHYTYSTGQNPSIARAAGATIEVLVTNIIETIQEVKSRVPALKAEVWFNKQDTRQLEQWLDCLEKMTIDLRMLRKTLNSRFLGEHTSQTTSSISHSREIRQIIVEEVGNGYNKLIDALIHTCVTCNFAADPTIQKRTNFDLNRLDKYQHITKDAFGKAIYRIAQQVDEYDSTTNIPVFAHVARRSTAMNSLLSIATLMIQFATKQEQQQDISPARESYKFFNLQQKWLWHDAKQRRLACKTAIGMVLASLWIVIPKLWEISQPFGLWPGLTVASVNLATTGSSFRKAIDRLSGTLFAAAYALLVVNLFSQDKDITKISAIAVFTFAALYMRDNEHTYQYTYAATSIGSMLYGSVKNDYNISGYVPQRIQLIFVGIITFAIVELFLFPRSSKAVVQKKILEYFDQLYSFVLKSRDFAQHLEKNNSSIDQKSLIVESENEHILLERSMEQLNNAQANLKSTALTLKAELSSALLEPFFGFEQKLEPQAMNGIVSEICETETQTLLVVKSLRSMMGYTRIGRNVTNYTSCPVLCADILDVVALQMKIITDGLHGAYPDGLLHPQNRNTLKAITAAASFRDLQDSRFSITARWSDHFQSYAGIPNVIDPCELVDMGITTSFVLELCRHLQLAGKRMEWQASHFPSLHYSN